jgi:CTP:molybdopterin cytidylyltransferase MocA
MGGAMPHLGALVLAAGYSSRMGRFKPLLPFGQSTVIESAIDSLRAAGIGDITVVAGYRAQELQPLLDRLSVRWVLNPAYEKGMYSSVVAGFWSLGREIEACFLLPGDMPGVRPGTVRSIAEDYASNRAPITYPVCAGVRGHPPLIADKVFPAILTADGAGGLRAVLAAYQWAVREVEVPDPGIHLDLDTPEQYSQVLARQPGIDPPSPPTARTGRERIS